MYRTDLLKGEIQRKRTNLPPRSDDGPLTRYGMVSHVYQGHCHVDTSPSPSSLVRVGVDTRGRLVDEMRTIMKKQVRKSSDN